MNKRSTFIFSALCFGFAFLYIPILLVVIYSFNDSRLVTIWGGLVHPMVHRTVQQRQYFGCGSLELSDCGSERHIRNNNGNVSWDSSDKN